MCYAASSCSSILRWRAAVPSLPRVAHGQTRRRACSGCESWRPADTGQGGANSTSGFRSPGRAVRSASVGCLTCLLTHAISSHRQEWQHRKGFCNDTPIVLVAAKMCFWLAETEEVALAAVLAMVALGKWSSGALPEADNRLYYTVLCQLLCRIIP